MIVDAIVLTGGRSSRLDSIAKSDLRFEGRTLLHRTLSAVSRARRTVVVGARPDESLVDGVLHTREDPPFGGPAAGIAAGMACLSLQPGGASDAVLVVACDMPHVERAVPPLISALGEHPDADGVVPVDSGGHRQPLAAVYRTTPFAAAIADHERAGSLGGVPVSRLVMGLDLAEITVPADATADVDTPDDAVRLGVSFPTPIHPSPSEGAP